MKIKLKNNPKGKSREAEIIESAEFFITKMVGQDKVNGLGTITISFRKMRRGVGGSAKYSRTHDYAISICKYQTMQEIKRIMAHELCHVKQYFLGELSHRRDVKMNRSGRLVCKSITVWKGKEILRSKYFTRKWEVEARRMESLATKRIPKTLKAKKEALKNTLIVEKPTMGKSAQNDNASIEKKVLNLLANGKVKNDVFVTTILEGITDKQEKIMTQKRIYNMREYKLIRLIYVDGVAYTELDK